MVSGVSVYSPTGSKTEVAWLEGFGGGKLSLWRTGSRKTEEKSRGPEYTLPYQVPSDPPPTRPHLLTAYSGKSPSAN